MIKNIILNELVKNGHEEKNGKRVWNIANRSFLHLTPELSAGFLNLINFEPYKKNVFNKEVKLIKDNMGKFIETIGTEEPINLIDIGCGDGCKALEFIKALNGKCNVRYCPVSPDDFLINLAITNIKKNKFDNVVEYMPHKSNFESLKEITSMVRTKEFQKNVILLHGSILASYEINDYLFALSNGMFHNDFMIIGNAIRTGERLVNLDLYKNKVFSDWFIHLMKELGFKEDEVEFDARFNNMRIEGLFKIKKARTIIHNDKNIEFKEGDEILVTFLYKYYAEELEKFFNMYFSNVKVVKDKEDEYLLVLCAK